jgi:hypothetical protein
MRRLLSLVTVAIFAAPALAASGAAKPSKSACAVAWNRSAPATLRSSIASAHPRGAFVTGQGTSLVIFWTKGGKYTTTPSNGCAIKFILKGGTTISVWGAWKAGSVPMWSGPVNSPRPVPVPNNSNVHADGTVGFHG